jgi:hypothetical protein
MQTLKNEGKSTVKLQNRGSSAIVPILKNGWQNLKNDWVIVAKNGWITIARDEISKNDWRNIKHKRVTVAKMDESL